MKTSRYFTMPLAILAFCALRAQADDDAALQSWVESHATPQVTEVRIYDATDTLLSTTNTTTYCVSSSLRGDSDTAALLASAFTRLAPALSDELMEHRLLLCTVSRTDVEVYRQGKTGLERVSSRRSTTIQITDAGPKRLSARCTFNERCSTEGELEKLDAKEFLQTSAGSEQVTSRRGADGELHLVERTTTGHSLVGMGTMLTVIEKRLGP